MRDVLMILMLLLAAVVLTAAALLWHRWTVYIMLSNKTVSLAVSLFGGRKRVFYRDFSAPKKKPEEPPKEDGNTGVLMSPGVASREDWGNG